jgi:hypothetical protein
MRTSCSRQLLSVSVIRSRTPGRREITLPQFLVRNPEHERLLAAAVADGALESTTAQGRGRIQSGRRCERRLAEVRQARRWHRALARSPALSDRHDRRLVLHFAHGDGQTTASSDADVDVGSHARPPPLTSVYASVGEFGAQGASLTVKRHVIQESDQG